MTAPPLALLAGLDDLGKQAPVIAVLCLAIAAMFWRIMVQHGRHLTDLERLWAQNVEQQKAENARLSRELAAERRRSRQLQK